MLADNERSLAFFSKLGYTPQSNKAGNGDLVVLAGLRKGNMKTIVADFTTLNMTTYFGFS